MNKLIKNFTHAFVVLCLLLLFCVDFVAASFSTTITQALCGYGIDIDSEGSKQARAEGIALTEKICEEGITLLKNKDNVLVGLQHKRVWMGRLRQRLYQPRHGIGRRRRRRNKTV